MCTNPIRIINKSHYHNPKAMRLYMYVPCGKCAECIRQKQAEWRLRSSIEYDDCVKHGGYAFFDTLTYRNDDIPRFRGYPCFNRKHIQDFLKLVRKRIVKYFNVRNAAFKVFYVSEYGHNYKRPHYHIIFFVRDGRITPVWLKRIIQSCWKHGFTDLRSVVNPHVGVIRSVACCDYVAKYVTKPDDYVDALYDSMRSEVSREDFRKYFYPFHQQSLSFGKALLDDPRQFEYFKNMKCFYNTNSYSLPLYYVRKLFYRLVVNDDGSSSWRETSAGSSYISAYKNKLYESYITDVKAFVDNIPQYLQIPAVYEKVSDYLEKVSFSSDSVYTFGDFSCESICGFFGRYDSDFVSRYSFWKRFIQGYLIYDVSFNPLIDTVSNVESSDLSYFDFQGSRSLDLVTDLSATYPKDYLVFSSLFDIVRSEIGRLDNNKVKLQKTLNSIFNDYYFV